MVNLQDFSKLNLVKIEKNFANYCLKRSAVKF